jgi:hypothetical protein
LLQAIEHRVNRLQEALDLRGEFPFEAPEGWLSVSERLAALEEDDLR